MTLNEIINLLIGWGPTILFLLIVIWAIISGIKKGVRRETISIIHTLVCFTICLIIFMLLVENRNVDMMFLEAINKILGGEGSLQNMLEVSTDAKTIRDVLVEYIPAQLSYVDGLELILKDNGAYLYTLVDMIYRVGFALIMFVLFLVLKLVCYILYLCFYSEKKHRKKVERDFANGDIDTGYKKHGSFGAFIGATRGLVAGLVTMSFIGTIFFIAAGGDGTKKQEQVDYGDETLNLVGDAYSSITEYGATGIFKVFNMVKDKNDVPYYLFAADLIFSGGLKDDNLNINQTIVLRDELAAYVSFARSTYSLLLKYGGDDLRAILKKDPEAKDPMNVFGSIVSKPEFQDEFDKFIVEFDSKTYFVNLALSLVDSIASNIDELNLGVTPESAEIIKICFKKGYLSSRIPDEKELLDKKNNDVNADKNKDKYELDYIRPSYLINGDDFKLVLRGFFDFINKSNTNVDTSNNTKFTLDLTSAIIDRVKYLSIFDTAKKDSLNPVIKRLYKYLDITYLENPQTLAGYNNFNKFDELDQIDWMGELLTLVKTVKVAIDTFAYDFIELKPNSDYFRMFLNEFKHDNPGYSKNIEGLEKISGFIGDSQILGQVLSSSLIYTNIYDALSNALNGELILKRDISYSNRYDSNGNLVEYGELYYLTNAISILAKEESLLNQVEALIYDLMSDEELNDTVMSLIDNLNKETNKGSIVDNLGSSSIGQSLLSSLVYSDTFQADISNYIDSSLLELDSDNKPIHLIKKDEIKGLLRLIPEVLPMINEFMAMPEFSTEDVVNLLEDPRIGALFDSKLLESIVSGAALENLSKVEGLSIVIPRSAKLVSDDSGNSELRSIYDIITSNVIDLNVILNASPNDYLDLILDLTDDDIDLLLASNLIYYTINNAILNSADLGITIVAPNTVTIALKDEAITKVINKAEFKKVFRILPELMPQDMAEIDPNEMLVAIAYNKDDILRSDVLTASIAYFVANDLDTGGVIEIPASLKEKATAEALVEGFDINPWPDEINSFVVALDELLDITGSGSINLDTIQDTILAEVPYLNDYSSTNPELTKLDLLYDSEIITNVLSAQIDASAGELFGDDLSDLKDKETNLYKKEEFSSLVHMLGLFEIDLNDLSDPSFDITVNINDHLADLNEIYDGNETNLDYLYHGNLLGVLLNKALTEAMVIVPADARVVDTNVISKGEAEALLSLAAVFGSLTDFSLEAVYITDLADNKEVLSKSKIFAANLYANIKDLVTIPNKVVLGKLNEEYLSEEELSSFINILSNEDNASLIFDKNMDGSYNLTSLSLDINTFDESSLDVLANLLESKILEATCLAMIGENEALLNGLPRSYRTDIEKINLIGNDKNLWIMNQEMSKLINSLKAVMNTSPEGANKISSFNDLSNTDKIFAYIDEGALVVPSNSLDNRESIDIAYDSVLIKANISSMLDSSLEPLVDSKVLHNKEVIRDEKNLEFYQIAEIKRLINAVKGLGLSVGSLSSFDVDCILNADYDKVNSSYLVASILTKEIDNAIKDIAYLDEINKTPAKLVEFGIEKYTSAELTSFINTLKNELNIKSLNNISIDPNIMLENYKIDNIYSEGSFVASSIITRQLDNVLASLVDKRVIDSIYVKESIDGAYRYKALEINACLASIKNDFGITDLNNININPDIILEDYKIDNIYGRDSYIIFAILTTKLDTVLDGQVPAKVLNSNIKEEYLDTKRYKASELNGLVEVLNGFKGPGNDVSLNDLSNLNVSLDNINDSYDRSLIAKGILTTHLNRILFEAGIKTHYKAYDDLDLLKWSEIEAIKSIGAGAQGFDINSMTLSNIETALFAIDGSYKSYLLASTLTESLKSTLVIPQSDYKDGLITPMATKALLACLDQNMTLNININDIRICAADTLYNSNILNATLVKNLRIDSYDLFVGKNNVIKDTDINGIAIYKFNEAELTGLIALVGEGQAITNIKLDINSILNGDINAISKSSIIECIVSELLITTVNSYIDGLPSFMLKPNKLAGIPTEVVSLNDYSIVTRNILAEAELQSAIELYKTIINI